MVLKTNNLIGLKWIIGCFSMALFFSCSSDDGPGKEVSLGEVIFVKSLGGSKNDAAQSVVKTTDGGYIVLGYTQSMDLDIVDKTSENFDFWLLKFNSDDQLQWNKTYGGSLEERGMDVIQTTDGGYAVLGFNKSSDGDTTENAGFQDYWILKLDASGMISWQKSFGFPGNDFGVSLLQTQDKGYLLTGVLDVTASGGEGNTSRSSRKHAGGDYWAIKLGEDGGKEWSHFYGGTFTDTPFDAIQTEEGGYIIIGSSDSNDVDISGNKGSYDSWVVKISNTGELQWEKSYGGSQIDEFRSIVNTGDGNYILIGNTRSNDQDISQNKGGADMWVIKISKTGEIIWEKALGGSDFDVALAVKNTQDNAFIIAGNSRSSDGNLNKNNGQNDIWVIKIDQNANIMWQETIGGSGIDQAIDVTQLNDGNIIVVGETDSSDLDIMENKGFTDAVIIKIK